MTILKFNCGKFSFIFLYMVSAVNLWECLFHSIMVEVIAEVIVKIIIIGIIIL